MWVRNSLRRGTSQPQADELGWISKPLAQAESDVRSLRRRASRSQGCSRSTARACRRTWTGGACPRTTACELWRQECRRGRVVMSGSTSPFEQRCVPTRSGPGSCSRALITRRQGLAYSSQRSVAPNCTGRATDVGCVSPPEDWSSSPLRTSTREPYGKCRLSVTNQKEKATGARAG